MISHYQPTDPASTDTEHSAEMLKRMNHTITWKNNTSLFDTLSFHTLLLQDLKVPQNPHSLLAGMCMKMLLPFRSNRSGQWN